MQKRGKRWAEYFIWIGWLLGLRWQWRICRFADLLGCGFADLRICRFAGLLVENFILIGWLFGMRQQLLKQVQHDWRIEHQGCFFSKYIFFKRSFYRTSHSNFISEPVEAG